VKGLAPIFGVVDVCDFPAIDPEVALIPKSDIALKRLGAHGRNEIL
jgi:hypothetical protein